ncbi:hypothetical protein QOZ80_3AG0226210 [Eleusine coracana subsp. coracana]|nr:hypothetical protein QOZ80_3AG0226210 [Eleusine coracana subsp. coracana]
MDMAVTKHPAPVAVTQQQQQDDNNAGSAKEEAPYERDIDAYLRSMERAPGRLPAPNYLDGGRSIKLETRAEVVGCLASAAHSLDVHSRTLHLAVSCLDRFLSSSTPDKVYSSSVAGVVVAASAALFAAAKYEEEGAPPEADEVVYVALKGHPLLCGDGFFKFTKAHLTAAERAVLRAVGYDMSAPTAHTFLDHFVERIIRVQTIDQHGHKSAALLASYLADLSLLDHGMLRFRPSVVAASALLVATLTHIKHPWSGAALEAATGYAAAELRECAAALNRLHRDSSSKVHLEGIKGKYSKSEFGRVATVLPLQDLFGAMETDDDDEPIIMPTTNHNICSTGLEDSCHDLDVSRIGEFLCCVPCKSRRRTHCHAN